MSKQDFKTDPRRKRDRERDITLSFLVEVSSFGHPSKLREEIGKRLAREVGLQFTSWDVVALDNDEHFEWTPEMHNGGDPYGDWLTPETVDVVEYPNSGDAIDDTNTGVVV